MDYEDKLLHVRKLEDYHPKYKDRTLQWAKIYFKMVQGDPDCELIENEIDWARLIKFILLELQAQKPIPLCSKYLVKKGFDLKKRSIHLTIQMLHNFVVVTTQSSSIGYVDKEEYKEDKEVRKNKSKSTYAPAVTMTEDEYKKLTEKHGEDITLSAIEILSNYKLSSGKKYKSDYYTLLGWPVDEAKKKMAENKPLTEF